ncbi:MAG: DUF4276 family protein [Verrucomicrobiota bacterium]|nr:DUF4276 family protein [Verrucomicrobiota bacterium]
MTRLFIHVEGETEETFVNEVLAPHLYRFGYQKVSARLLGNSRNRSRRGGIKAWNTVRSDIINHLKEDPQCLATTMVDYYALPQEGDRAWPGRADAGMIPFPEKSATVQRALLEDVCKALGDGFNPRRFIPYVMMHEFEGLLFSDCTRFAESIGRNELAGNFQSIRNAFPSPEAINDSPLTAPSKRVESLVAGYEKPLLGTLAILGIGLDVIRHECPHFHNWMEQLEQWCKITK